MLQLHTMFMNNNQAAFLPTLRTALRFEREKDTNTIAVFWDIARNAQRSEGGTGNTALVFFSR